MGERFVILIISIIISLASFLVAVNYPQLALWFGGVSIISAFVAVIWLIYMFVIFVEKDG